MHSKKSILFLLSLTFLVIFQVVNGTEPIKKYCYRQKDYNASSQYEINLKGLIHSLRVKAPPTGFAFGSIGKGKDRVNGLALCRGDISNTTCKTCINEASTEITQQCRNKEAIIWYDHCLLKYSNQNFFGSNDFVNRFYYIMPVSANNPSLMNQKSAHLLSSLARNASSSRKLYATGEALVSGESNDRIYGLVQCTRDLKATVCKKCLDFLITELPICCRGTVAGRVISGSCNIRYENYPFLNA